MGALKLFIYAMTSVLVLLSALWFALIFNINNTERTLMATVERFLEWMELVF